MSNQVTNLFCHPTRSAAMIRPNLTHSSFGECGGPRGDGLPRGIAKTRDHEVIGPLSRVPFGRTVQTLRPLATLLESLPGMLNVDSADIVQILSDGILRTLCQEGGEPSEHHALGGILHSATLCGNPPVQSILRSMHNDFMHSNNLYCVMIYWDYSDRETAIIHHLTNGVRSPVAGEKLGNELPSKRFQGCKPVNAWLPKITNPYLPLDP